MVIKVKGNAEGGERTNHVKGREEQERRFAVAMAAW